MDGERPAATSSMTQRTSPAPCPNGASGPDATGEREVLRAGDRGDE
jgi:hypothetical protein